MQEDMHYYGTYALARCAGLPVEISRPLAYSAQFVDDSEQSDSETHEDGGMLYGIATAHDNVAVVKNQLIDHIAQRRVWVPFHFFPGNIGDTLQEKMVCRKFRGPCKGPKWTAERAKPHGEEQRLRFRWTVTRASQRHKTRPVPRHTGAFINYQAVGLDQTL